MSDLEFDPHSADMEHDHAPGDEPLESAGHWVMNYLIGLGLATLLTIGSFVTPLLPGLGLLWTPSVPVALVVLAIAQMGVHLVFFLHITTGPDNTNNVLALAFGVFIVVLVVLGSLWIMHNMAVNMHPMTSGMASHGQMAAPIQP
jgi:cytochrome o ubiquinol oxidase operon protein cyoD